MDARAHYTDADDGPLSSQRLAPPALEQSETMAAVQEAGSEPHEDHERWAARSAGGSFAAAVSGAATPWRARSAAA